MIITKKHKLYYKTRKGEVKNLYKSSPSVYLGVITEFITGDGNKRYAHLNQFAKVRKDFMPVDVSIDPLYSAEFKKLLRDVHGADSPRTSLVVSYNGSWQPLAEVSLERVEEIKVDKPSIILVAIISKRRKAFHDWAKEKSLDLSNHGASSKDSSIKYTPVHNKDEAIGTMFDYYEVIEDWDGAAELIGIIETRLKKD